MYLYCHMYERVEILINSSKYNYPETGHVSINRSCIYKPVKRDNISLFIKNSLKN